jgi:transcriptional regulator with XRE-family HTH domain
MKAAREKAGVSQRELARLSGILPANVSRYEADLREPSWSAVQKIAAALGIDVRGLADPDLAPVKKRKGRR